MFSLQEYQHVHLLWLKKRSFTLVWKPNPPLRSVRCAHLRARADAASESTMGAHCSHSAYAPLLLCLRVRCETGVNQALLKRSRWKRLISEIFLLLQCATTLQWALKQMLWSSADHVLAQVRPRQIFTRTLSKNGRKCDHFGRSLEPCICNYYRRFKRSLMLQKEKPCIKGRGWKLFEFKVSQPVAGVPMSATRGHSYWIVVFRFWT